MTTFNTGNPIGSTDARDLSDNAENFDIALGTAASTWVDRLGVTRDSFEGRLAKGSFYRAGTFSAGYTLTNMRQTLEYSGHEYSWAGTFQKVVAAGSTPETSGGIGAGAWIDRTDETLRVDLAGSGGIRLSAPCVSIAELISIASPQNGQRIDVIGFYAERIVGGGTFVFNSSVAKSTHNGITIISPTVPFSGVQSNLSAFLSKSGETDPLGSGCWVRIVKNGVIETADGGAVIDGVTDDTVACQAVHNVGLNVNYTAGSYLFSGVGLTPVAGTRITAAGFGFFNSNQSRSVTIINNTVNGGVFSYISDTSTAQKDAPRIQGFHLKADYPIRFNNHYDFIADGAAGTNPYLMRPEVIDCYIEARVAGTGIGCVFAKCFDGEITNNEIYNFAINLVLLGSDINSVHRNRFVGASVYHIYDRSAQSFGSQNEIHNNDILASADGATYIKTSSHHVRIYDNYLEKTSGSIVGFIDNSPNPGLVWNAGNVESNSKSVCITDNRIDGRVFCTDFVYRIDNTTPPTLTKIHESGTTGVASATADVISIIGTPNGLLRYRRGLSNSNNCEYDLIGSGFKRLNGFKTRSFGNLQQINAANFCNLIGNDIYSNGAEEYVRTNGESIVLLPAMSVYLYAGLDPSEDGIINPNFEASTTYTITVLARTTSGSGDILGAGKLSGGSGETLTNMELTTQFKKFTFIMTGSASTARTGFYFARSTSNGNIEIKSVEW